MRNILFRTYAYYIYITLSKAMENRISSFEMWTYRKMMKMSWKRMKTNKDILKMAGRKQTALVGLVKERKAKYFGHVKRHQNLLKDMLEGRVEGTRPRGKPRINWEENIKSWSGLKLQECTRMAEDIRYTRVEAFQLNIVLLTLNSPSLQ